MPLLPNMLVAFNGDTLISFKSVETFSVKSKMSCRYRQTARCTQSKGHLKEKKRQQPNKLYASHSFSVYYYNQPPIFLRGEKKENKGWPAMIE